MIIFVLKVFKVYAIDAKFIPYMTGLYHLYYRLSVLAVNNGMQCLFRNYIAWGQFHFGVDIDWGFPVWESKPLGG